MFKKVLVPLDGSPLAECALSPAIALACAAADDGGRGHLILLSIPVYEEAIMPLAVGNNIYWSEAQNTAEHQRAVRNDVENYLHTIRNNHESPRLAISAKIIEGDVAGVIVDTAEDAAVDLIVLSTHGRSGLSRWMLGSVAERVLHSAPCPVLVVRDDTPIRHMMITLDGSPLAEKALEPALAIAKKLNCQTTLFRVEQPLDYSPTFVKELESAEPGLGQQYLADISSQAASYLEQLVKNLRQRGLAVKGVVSSGPVAQQILDYAEFHDVDLIAMCTHGRTGLQRWVYGSVTEKIVRGSQSAMLIVHA